MKKLSIFETGMDSNKKIPTDNWDITRLLHAIYYISTQTNFYNTIENETLYLKDIKPLRIRHERIVAVMDAYNIKVEKDYPINSFLNGSKNLNMQLSKSDILQMLQPIIEATPKHEGFIKRTLDYRYDSYPELYIRNMYQGLIDYRLKLEKIAYDGRGGLTASIPMMYIKDYFSDKYLIPNLKFIDNLIIQSIAGDFRTISDAELIEKYNYPSVSNDELSDIDADWY